jgi:hypothetical protein
VEVDGGDVVERHLPDDPHADGGEPTAVGGQIGRLEDHHVAAVAAALVEEPSRRRAVADRRDDLEELRADRHDGVLEPELADARIAEPDLETEDGAEVADDRLERARDEGDLADVHQRP